MTSNRWTLLALLAFVLCIVNGFRILFSSVPAVPLLAAACFAVMGVACLIQALKERR